jgi:hypothetical protein
VAASAQLRFRGRWRQSTEHPGGGGGFRRESLPRALWHSSGGRDLVGIMRSQCSFPPCRRVRVSNSPATFAADGPKARDDLAVASWATDDPVVGGSLWRNSTASDFMFPLALTFGKCQTQVPTAPHGWHIPMVGFIPFVRPRL